MTLPAGRGATMAFSTLAVLWMLAAGVISGLLFVVLTAYAPDLRRETDGGVNVLSRSAVGFAGVAELMRMQRVLVLASRTPHPERFGPASLLVLTPNVGGDAAAATALKSPGLELVILPKWRTQPDKDHPGWVLNAGLLPSQAIEAGPLHAFDARDHLVRAKGRSRPVLTATKAFFAAGSVIPAGQIDSLQTLAGPDPGWIAAVVDQNGATVLAKQVDHEVYLLSDPDLMNNQGLAQLDNARGASALLNTLRDGRQPVRFDVTLAGLTRQPSLLRLALEPPFLAATLCALAAALLVGLHAAVRFGPGARPSRAFDLGKRALADNSAALIAMVRREHRMGRGYAALIRARTARAVGAPRDLDEAQMDAMMDRLGRFRRVGEDFSKLDLAAREARDVPGLMAAAQALHQWRSEMMREHR